MTINAPSTGSCPEWVEDVPADRLAEFKALLAGVQQLILSSANRAVLAPTDVCGWHQHLFNATVPLDYYAGNFRCAKAEWPCLAVNVAVGGVAGSDYRFAGRHVELVFKHLREQLTSVELGWSSLSPGERAYQVAVLTANLVGGFIRIHPFVNGNGRTSRLLWRWCLFRFGVPPQHQVHPRPNPPYAEIMAQAMRGNYGPLALFVLTHLQSNRPAQT